MFRFELRAAGLEALTLPLCYTAPHVEPELLHIIYPVVLHEVLTDSVKELPAAAVLQEDELSLALQPAAVALDDVGVLQQLVDTDFFPDGLLQVGTVLEGHLLHGAGLPGVAVDQKLDLGEGALAQDLHQVPAFDEFANHGGAS